MIRFSKFIWLYIILSGLVIIPGCISLFRYGLKQSVDFSGGTLLELSVKPTVSQSEIEVEAKKVSLNLAALQKSGQDTYILRTHAEESQKFSVLLENLYVASASPLLVRQETVGPLLGKELLQKAIVAAALAIGIILLYVAYAFKNVRFGVAAIMALLHDLLVVLGSFSLFGHFLGVEVDTLFVTAFLTTMSFSVHDTIVVFDRIREYQNKRIGSDFEEICDRALTETMGRSLANSMTIIFMLLALVLLGGNTTHWFAMALLIGTISGTYSSDFVATPILILWHRWSKNT